jgi:VanZ family protein
MRLRPIHREIPNAIGARWNRGTGRAARGALPEAGLYPRYSPLAPSRELLRVVWLLAILAVIVGSLLPANSLAIRTLDRFPVSDKIEHAGMYALLAFLPAVRERRNFVIGAAAGAMALGVGLEFAQRLSGWRNFEVADMIADGIGVCLGLLLGAVTRTRLRDAKAPILVPEIEL